MNLADIGKFGGTVLRGTPGAEGRAYQPGDEVAADEALAWPVANRHALESTGYVQWHAGRSVEEPPTKPVEKLRRQRV